MFQLPERSAMHFMVVTTIKTLMPLPFWQSSQQIKNERPIPSGMGRQIIWNVEY